LTGGGKAAIKELGEITMFRMILSKNSWWWWRSIGGVCLLP
jgi:hypothetical protein